MVCLIESLSVDKNTVCICLLGLNKSKIQIQLFSSVILFEATQSNNFTFAFGFFQYRVYNMTSDTLALHFRYKVYFYKIHRIIMLINLNKAGYFSTYLNYLKLFEV